MSPVNPSTLIRHPAAERNKGPILKILQNIFAETSKEIRNFLEIGLFVSYFIFPYYQ